MSSATDITGTIAAGLARRHRRERRFRAYGVAALLFSGLMLAVLLVTIIRPGMQGFTRHELRLEIDTAPFAAILRDHPEQMDFYAHTNTMLRSMAGGVLDKVERQQLYRLIGFFSADTVKKQVMRAPQQWPDAVTVWIPLSDNADQLLKGHIDRTLDAALRPLNDRQIAWLDAWQQQGRIRSSFNWDFFSHGDSRAPEAAGFGGAVVGSLLTLLICLVLAFPVAIMAAITLEEFARKSRAAEWLEITINNLAAVPSIIYGLLGLSVFLQLFGMPRSSALVGGLTLAILILPVMIIAARASIRAVPPSMRAAATALGATRLQVVRHHVLPYALPGIMTGTILSICRALGETAPLLMIGMVAFVADIPRGVSDPATVMPVEIYLWASSPELGFVEKTSTAIMVLLVILLLLNVAAIRLRNASQKTWN
ncbi:MAG: phosphate ABC transporter permease PstA [Pseudomonadota bacterium]